MAQPAVGQASNEAEHFVAQHAIGGVGLGDALRLRALVAAQRIDAGIERAPLFGVGAGIGGDMQLPRLPPAPTTPAGHGQQQHGEQPEQGATATAAAWCGRDRGTGNGVGHGNSASGEAVMLTDAPPRSRR